MSVIPFYRRQTTKSQKWITWEHEVGEPINLASAQILAHIREEAKKASAGIIAFLTFKEDYKATELHQFCDEYIEVAPCEPDPGDSVAFSIDFVSIRHLNVLGVGKQMCSISVSAGEFRRRYTQFIAPDLETRVMWALRCQGKKLAEIGSLFGVNKSTVLRRLQGLPDQPFVDLGADWLKRCLELLPDASTGDCDADTDVGDDDDDDIGVDEDDDIDDLSEGHFEN